MSRFYECFPIARPSGFVGATVFPQAHTSFIFHTIIYTRALLRVAAHLMRVSPKYITLARPRFIVGE